MLITFWCYSDITFLRGLHKKNGVLYFSVINVFWLLNLWGAGGDANFAPQANLVFFKIFRFSKHVMCTPTCKGWLNVSTSFGHMWMSSG